MIANDKTFETLANEGWVLVENFFSSQELHESIAAAAANYPSVSDYDSNPITDACPIYRGRAYKRGQLRTHVLSVEGALLQRRTQGISNVSLCPPEMHSYFDLKRLHIKIPAVQYKNLDCGYCSNCATVYLSNNIRRVSTKADAPLKGPACKR